MAVMGALPGHWCGSDGGITWALVWQRWEGGSVSTRGGMSRTVGAGTSERSRDLCDCRMSA